MGKDLKVRSGTFIKPSSGNASAPAKESLPFNQQKITRQNSVPNEHEVPE